MDNAEYVETDSTLARAASVNEAPAQGLPSSLQFLLKGFVCVGILYAIARSLELMLPGVIALVAALAIAFATLGYTYTWVVKRSHRRLLYREGGWRARLGQGAFFPILFFSLLSTYFIASLFFSMPLWSANVWIMLVISVPLYWLLRIPIENLIRRGYEDDYYPAFASTATAVALGVLLCAGYVLIIAMEPSVEPISAVAAIEAAPQPFANSPSAALSELGLLDKYVEGMAAFGASAAAQTSPVAYIVIQILLMAGSFMGFAQLLSVCSFHATEIERCFKPYAVGKQSEREHKVQPTSVVAACIVPVLFAVCFLCADTVAAQAKESGEFTPVEELIRERAGVVAALIDGKLYDPEGVRRVFDDATTKYEALSNGLHEELVASINSTCDQQIANVDGYLDWYYSLGADYERLLQFFTGTIEDGMKTQLESRINEGIETADLDARLEDFASQASSIKQELVDELAQYELGDIPEWMVVNTEAYDLGTLLEPPQPTQQLLQFRERVLVSGAVGTTGGLLAGKGIAKLLQKSVFKNMTSKLATALARHGLLRGVAGAAGSLVAPGVGTVAGLAIGVATDYLFVKADEALNREQYRDELIAAIEENRQELLAGLAI